MAQKQKIARTAKVSDDAAKISRQKKLIQQLKKKENWMKWALVASLIVILLLLLFIGYATDWTTGLRKDAATTPISTDLDSSKSGTGSDAGTSGTGSNGSGGAGSNGGTGGTGGTGSTGGSGTNTTTDRSSSNTSSTTNNSSTTTNNNTTTPAPTSTPEDNLLTLFVGTNVGESIEGIIAQAQGLGIGVECSDVLLIKECTFTAGNTSFSTKSVSGIITSVLGA